MKKRTKLIIAILAIILISIISIGGFIGNYFYNLALNPYTSKDMVFASQDDGSELEVKSDVDWLLNNSDYTDTYITSFDNLKLHAYEIKNKHKTNKWAIIVHGYISEGSLSSSKAKHFYDMGYNVLVPDLRAHGKSQGDYIGMGCHDRLDIIDWIKTIIKNNPNSQIVLHGTSMGSATVLSTSGEDLPQNVKAIIADCGYTSAWDVFSYQLKLLFNLPPFPAMDLANMVTMVKAGYSLKEASPISQVAHSKTPILFIHGDKDDFVPYSMMDKLYNATSSQKEKLTIKGATHAKAELVNPKLYWSSVNNFLNKYVK